VKEKLMSHTIKVYVVDGHLQYIDHDLAHPTADTPGLHVKLKPQDKVKWQVYGGGNTIQLIFHPGTNGDPSPFASGDTNIPTAASNHTGLETINQGAPTYSGDNPVFKYDVIVQTAAGPIEDDPDILMDLTGGGGPPKKKASKKAAKKKSGKSKK